MHYLFPVSVVLQTFAICHIFFYRRKYQDQDNNVYSIHISPPDEETNEHRNISCPPANDQCLNTRQYNKILYDIEIMIIFAVTLIILVILVNCLPVILTDSSTLYIPHIVEHAVFFTLNIILPCSFYICNCNARLYIKELFMNT